MIDAKKKQPEGFWCRKVFQSASERMRKRMQKVLSYLRKSLFPFNFWDIAFFFFIFLALIIVSLLL
jgi:hypothetical protein